MKEKREDIIEFYGGPYIGLLPTILFVIFALITTLGFHCFAMKGLTLSAFLSVLIVFFLAKKRGEYFNTVASGLGEFRNAKLIVIFLFIGMFTKLLTVAKVGQGFVWLGSTLAMGPSEFCILAFLGTAVFALGSGVPFAALFSSLAVFYVPGVCLGANPAIVAGAVLGGVYCGDSLSPSSQLTNATREMQRSIKTGKGADLVGILKQRSPFIGIIAIITIIALALTGGIGGTPESAEVIKQFSDPRGLWMIIPIVILAAICIKTREILIGLTIAIIVGCITALAAGVIHPTDIIAYGGPGGNPTGIIIDGMYSLVDLAMLCVFTFGIIAIMKRSGMMAIITEKLLANKFVRKPGGAEATMMLGAGIVNFLLCGGELPALLYTGDMANRIGQAAGISPERRTYLLIGAAMSIFGVVPVNSVFIMGVLTQTTNLQAQFSFLPIPSAFGVFFASYFSIILTLVAICWAVFGLGRTYEKAGEQESVPAADLGDQLTGGAS